MTRKNSTTGVSGALGAIVEATSERGLQGPLVSRTWGEVCLW